LWDGLALEDWLAGEREGQPVWGVRTFSWLLTMLEQEVVSRYLGEEVVDSESLTNEPV